MAPSQEMDALQGVVSRADGGKLTSAQSSIDQQSGTVEEEASDAAQRRAWEECVIHLLLLFSTLFFLITFVEWLFECLIS